MEGIWQNDAEFLPPRVKDKQGIFEYAVDQAKSTNLHDAGMILGLAINGLHLFTDGNGRTSRIIYTLFANGYNASPEDQEVMAGLMSGEARGDLDVSFSDSIEYTAEKAIVRQQYGVDFSSFDTPKRFLSDNVPFVGEWKPQLIESSGDLVPVTRNEICDLLNERETIQRAAGVFAARHPEVMTEDVLLRFTPDKSRNPHTAIALDTLMPRLTQLHYQELADIAYDIKREALKYVITSIAHPETATLKSDQGPMSFRDFFVEDSRTHAARRLTDKPTSE
jgi:hypothetical protein